MPTRINVPLAIPERANEMWSVDFMNDVLVNKRKLRTLNVIDDYIRQAIIVEAAHSMPAMRVTQILERTSHEQGKPACIRVDNGPELISKKFKEWCMQKGITISYTQPGKPMQNGYIERFNRTFRENILDAYLFADMARYSNWLMNEWKITIIKGHMKH